MDFIAETIETSFQYNRTFAEAPSNETNQAWETIFPPRGGFFRSPTVKDGGSLAVYHQLHCLVSSIESWWALHSYLLSVKDGIRHAYWALHEGLTAARDKSFDFDGLPRYSTTWHTRHCIDFLRQMLMCNADTTIEFSDPDLHGIVGFGVKHQCKQWDQIKQWTIDRQSEWQDE